VPLIFPRKSMEGGARAGWGAVFRNRGLSRRGGPGGFGCGVLFYSRNPLSECFGLFGGTPASAGSCRFSRARTGRTPPIIGSLNF